MATAGLSSLQCQLWWLDQDWRIRFHHRADRLALAVGFSPYGPRHSVALPPHTCQLGSKSERPKKEEVETASFLSPGSRNWHSVISTIVYWLSITEISGRNAKESRNHSPWKVLSFGFCISPFNPYRIFFKIITELVIFFPFYVL